MKYRPRFLSAAAVALLSLLAVNPAAADITKAEQAALTPQTAFDRLVSGHQRFLTGQSRIRDQRAAVAATGSGQYPGSVIIACLDSRTSTELIFDQGLGESFCGRIAGNFVDNVMLGSIEFGVKVAGAPLIVVLGHTDCGAIKGACDGVKLGHLTATLAALDPAIASVRDDGEPRKSTNKVFVQRVTDANVRVTVSRVQSESEGLAALLARGKVGIIGGVYDLRTGKIKWLADTAVNVKLPAE